MTDRVKGFLVVLTGDAREDDAEPLRQAISLLQNVQEVTPIPANPGDFVNRQRVRNVLEERIFKVLHEDDEPF